MADGADRKSTDEIEITPAMVEVGKVAILEEVGGADDLGAFFEAADLAQKVYLAMERRRREAKGSQAPRLRTR
jgi:hypothetical protein